MKLITIGDLHGSDAWTEVVPEAWDKIIFIGDYVDSYEYEEGDILLNLNKIIDLKESQPEKVILLWGNHDLAYFYGGHRRHSCSGFNKAMLPAYFNTFTANRKLFQAAYQEGNYLWTHAGVVKNWYESYIRDEILPEDNNLAETLNRLFNEYYAPLFFVSLLRGGMNENGAIFWAHSSETRENPLPGYHQVIGHTHTRSGILHFDNYGNDTALTYIDCLDTSIEFYKLEL